MQWQSGAHDARTVAQNTTAIQAALDAAASGPERELHVRGMYTVNPLTIPDGVTVKCFGDGSGFKANVSGTLLTYAPAGGVGARAKAVTGCSLNMNDIATTGFQVAAGAKLEISNLNIFNGPLAGSTGLDLVNAQNALISKIQVADQEIGMRIRGTSSLNLIQAIDCEHVTKYCITFEATGGDQQTGNIIIGGVLERERRDNTSCTGSGAPLPCCTGVGTGTCTGAPYPEPLYHVYATGGRDITILNTHIGTPAQRADMAFIGPGGTTLPVGQDGVNGVTLIDVSYAMTAQNASAECLGLDNPYDCCTGAGTGCVQDYDTSGDCGLYFDGAVQASVYSPFVQGGNTRCYVEAEAASSTVVTVYDPKFQTGDSYVRGTVIERVTTSTGEVRTYIGDAEKTRIAASDNTVWDSNVNLRSTAASHWFRCQTGDGFSCGMRFMSTTGGDRLLWTLERDNNATADLTLTSYDNSGGNATEVMRWARDGAGDRRGQVTMGIPTIKFGYASASEATAICFDDDNLTDPCWTWNPATNRTRYDGGILELNAANQFRGIATGNAAGTNEWGLINDSGMDGARDFNIWNNYEQATPVNVVNFDDSTSASTHSVGTTSLGRATTFFTGVFVDWINQERRSDGYTDIATALADLPSTDGLLRVDSDENDTTAFVDTNPATASTGKQDALVADMRDGKNRVLSSADQPHCGSGNNCTMAQVPFQRWVRLDDPTKAYSDSDTDGTLDGGAIGEWSAFQDIGSCETTTSTACNADGDCPSEKCVVGYCSTTTATRCKTAVQCPAGESCVRCPVSGGSCTAAWDRLDEYKNMPNIGGSHYKGGKDAAGDNSWIVGGGCNIGESFCSGDGSKRCLVDGDCGADGPCFFAQTVCSGPLIDAVGVETDSSTGTAGETRDRPIFGVHMGGVAIYEPLTPPVNTFTYGSALTIFAGQPNDMTQFGWNRPVFLVPWDGGIYTDGGSMFGNKLAWPHPRGSHRYPAFQLAAHHDVGSTDPAIGIFGSSNAGAFAQSPLLEIYDKSFCPTRGAPCVFWDYLPGEDVQVRKSFSFQADSTLWLGSYDEDDGAGQRICFKGVEPDGATGGYTEITDNDEICMLTRLPTADRNAYLPDLSGTVVVSANDPAPRPCTTWFPGHFDPAENATRYVSINGSATLFAVETNAQSLTPAALEAHQLRVEVDAAPTGSETWVVTLMDNTSATSLTCTITGSATTCTDLTHVPAIAASRKVDIKVVGSASVAAAGTMLVSFCMSP
jgi:hypothetical protein